MLLGAVLVGAGVALLLHNTLAFRRTAETTLREDQYLLHAVRLESLVLDAETGLRGAVITDRALFLQPLRHAESELPAAVAALERSAAQTRIDRIQVAALLRSIHAYMADYVPGVLALVRSDPPAARSFSVTLEGKREVDAIRRNADALDQRLSADGAARQQQARRRATQSVDEAVAVLVLLTLLTVALGAYLGHLAVTREHARAQSEATAQTLQQSIMPPPMPAIGGCELAACFLPGAGPVSGDFYDAFALGPDRLAIMVGDVCGKGAPAAAATAMARWTLRAALSRGESPAEALQLLNSVLIAQPEPRLTTALCLTMSLQAGAAQVEVACAGHPAPILVPAEGAVEALPARGELLGAFSEIRLRTARATLQVGDALVAYTDGVTDQGPESSADPVEILSGHRGEPADQLASALERAVPRSPGRQPDDVAVIAVRFTGGPQAGAPRAEPKHAELGKDERQLTREPERAGTNQSRPAS